MERRYITPLIVSLLLMGAWPGYAEEGVIEEIVVTVVEVGGRNIFDEFPDPQFNLGGIESFVHDIRGAMWYARLTQDL